MRDGKRLYTAVYVPKDASAAVRYPIMLMRTPYGIAPYGEENYTDMPAPSEALLRSQYIFVHQDVRGAFSSWCAANQCGVAFATATKNLSHSPPAR